VENCLHHFVTIWSELPPPSLELHFHASFYLIVDRQLAVASEAGTSNSQLKQTLLYFKRIINFGGHFAVFYTKA